MSLHFVNKEQHVQRDGEVGREAEEERDKGHSGGWCDTTTSARLSEHFSWEEPALTDGCNNQTARPLRFDRDRVSASTRDTERVGNAVGTAGPVVTAGFIPAVSPIKRIDKFNQPLTIERTAERTRHRSRGGPKG